MLPFLLRFFISTMIGVIDIQHDVNNIVSIIIFVFKVDAGWLDKKNNDQLSYSLSMNSIDID